MPEVGSPANAPRPRCAVLRLNGGLLTARVGRYKSRVRAMFALYLVVILGGLAFFATMALLAR